MLAKFPELRESDEDQDQNSFRRSPRLALSLEVQASSHDAREAMCSCDGDGVVMVCMHHNHCYVTAIRRVQQIHIVDHSWRVRSEYDRQHAQSTHKPQQEADEGTDYATYERNPGHVKNIDRSPRTCSNEELLKYTGLK